MGAVQVVEVGGGERVGLERRVGRRGVGAALVVGVGVPQHLAAAHVLGEQRAVAVEVVEVDLLAGAPRGGHSEVDRSVRTVRSDFGHLRGDPRFARPHKVGRLYVKILAFELWEVHIKHHLRSRLPFSTARVSRQDVLNNLKGIRAPLVLVNDQFGYCLHLEKIGQLRVNQPQHHDRRYDTQHCSNP